MPPLLIGLVFYAFWRTSVDYGSSILGQLQSHFTPAPNATPTYVVNKDATFTPSGVRTSTTAGKLRRRGKFAGYRADWKKAYVRLKAGEKMPEYAEI